MFSKHVFRDTFVIPDPPENKKQLKIEIDPGPYFNILLLII